MFDNVKCSFLTSEARKNISTFSITVELLTNSKQTVHATSVQFHVMYHNSVQKHGKELKGKSIVANIAFSLPFPIK